MVIAIFTVWQLRKNSASDKWKTATDYYRRADYDNAAKILNKVSMPKDAERLAIYAQTMLATRQLEKAAKAYTELYKVKKDPFAKLVLGNIYNEQKRYTDAEKIYKEIIASDPTYSQAYVNLSTMYKVQGNTTEAIATAQKAVDNNPNSVVLNELLVSMTMGDKKSAAYLKAVDQLKKLNPNDPLLKSLK